MKDQLTIGIVIGNANSPHTIAVIDGINAAAKELKINQITMINVQADSVFQRHQKLEDKKRGINPVFNMIDYGKLDGILVSYGTLTNYISDAERLAFLQYIDDIPHVMMEADVDVNTGSSVTSDNYAGMYSLVNHLIKDHHRKNLTCLAGPATNGESNLRVKAFMDALSENNLDCDENRVIYGDFTPWVTSQIAELHSRYPEMDAMICGNDHMANTAEQYFISNGFQIGTDISITGYDNWNVSEYMSSPLTTVSKNSYRMGYESTFELVRLLNGGAPSKIRIPSRPIFRASCGCEYHTTNLSENVHEVIASYENQFSSFRQQTWQLPLISQSMMGNMASDETFYREALDKLYSLGSRHSFLFIFEHSVKMDERGFFNSDEPLELVAASHWDKTTAFPPGERIRIFEENGFSELFPTELNYSLCVFSLTADDRLYGFLALDIKSAQIALFHAISLQISNTLRFYELSIVQRETRKELEETIRELGKKNEVMSFISEYDTLTGILNRRGFMEAVLNFMSKNPALPVTLLFADLDHLKMINDIFGHSEGDFAIQETAKLLKDVLPMGSIIARIGGDEYVALFPDFRDTPAEDIILNVRAFFDAYNNNSSKNYYIELSLGYTRFTCSPDITIGQFMDQADQKLYIAKKTRRRTVMKLTRQNGKVPITGLPLESSLQEFFHHHGRENLHGFALHFDIDDMRGINARLGIEKGDLALQITVDSIQETMTENQILYRVGGDEFLLLDTSCTSIDQAITQYNTIRKGIDTYLQNSLYELMFSVSSGLVDLSDLTDDPYHSLLKYAEFTLAEAKKAGTSTCVLFDQDAYKHHLRRQNLVRELRTAVGEHFEGFSIHYQPLFKRDNKLNGAEALLRFESHLYGSVTPAEFIPLLEETGLIIPTGVWVIKEALSMCKEALVLCPDFEISFNISPVQIQKSAISEVICEEVKNIGIESSHVIAELTESQYLENDQKFTHFWTTLKKQGIKVALDDFGTGYSNFHYLNELRPNIIKIDHSFTSTAFADVFEFELLQNMVDLANNLNLSVCIEGIESEKVKEVMMTLSPTYYQGYLFGMPCPKEVFFEQFLNK